MADGLQPRALMADGHIDGDNLICGVHGMGYRYDTGFFRITYNEEVLQINSPPKPMAKAVYE